MFDRSSENQDPELSPGSSKGKAALPSGSITYDPDTEGEVMTGAHFPRGLPEIVLDYLDNDVKHSWLGDKETKPFSKTELHQFMLFGVRSKELISAEASFVATLILSGKNDDIEAALALVKENPHLVHCLALASDLWGRPVKGTPLQIAAMAGDVDLKPGIVKEEEQGVVERLITVAGLSRDEVAEQLKVVTSEEAIRENEARNQQILEAIKRFGEGIIALESKGDDNLEQVQAKCQPLIDRLEKDLRTDANRVLISGHIFDPIKETLDWYDTNFDLFSNWIKRDALESKGDDNLEQVQAKYQPLIDQLEKDLRPDANRVLISGYIFDPMILKETLDWYDTNFNRFSDWNLRNVFIINGYGKLQAQLSSRDAQVVLNGIGPAMERGKIPFRSLNNADGSSYFSNPQSRLGIDFFVGYYGSCSTAPWERQDVSRGMESLCRTKTAVLQDLCGHRPRPSRTAAQ